jgi:hypothetical protein
MVSRGDFTVHSYDELRAALKSARSGQVVFLPGEVQIDMTGKQTLTVPAGVAVASDRGQHGSAGALIYLRSAKPYGMFETGGGYVRFTGLRLRGPHADTSPAPNSMGIRVKSFAAEIDNCEVWAFTCPAISVYYGARRAYVHHCYLHHNQRSGLGYSVAVDDADVLVEACRFDYGRHFITCSNGTPGTGYEARYNICGPHCIGHLFDVHGEASGSGVGVVLHRLVAVLDFHDPFEVRFFGGLDIICSDCIGHHTPPQLHFSRFDAGCQGFFSKISVDGRNSASQGLFFADVGPRHQARGRALERVQGGFLGRFGGLETAFLDDFCPSGRHGICPDGPSGPNMQRQSRRPLCPGPHCGGRMRSVSSHGPPCPSPDSGLDVPR